MTGWRAVHFGVVALCLAVPLGSFAETLAPGAPTQPEATVALADTRGIVRAQEFMVVAAHPLAAQAGHDILAAGGSAGDAAVAVQLVLGLVEPQSSGLGGGGFAVYFDAALGRLTTYDARETAPAEAGPDLWLDADGAPLPFWDAVIGGRSVGVPGTPLLLERLHRAHGRLPLADLVAPALALAEGGFAVSERMAASVAAARGLEVQAAARAYFLPGGEPLAEGALLRNPAYARTLRLFAAEGAAPFYHGAMARDIVAAVRGAERPGLLRMEDLRGYEVIERSPVCIDYRGHAICGMGPPSSGALTLGQMLGMLEGFDLGAEPTVAALHLLAEAGRLAFADRDKFMADSDVTAMPEGLLNRGYLAARSALIDPDSAAPGSVAAGDPPWDEAAARAPDDHRPRQGTTHFVIVDRHGDMISATTTIETGFGARLMVNGYLLNNELTDFAFRPQVGGAPVANRVEGGKRPRSSMAPTVVLREGRPVLLIGSPGGANIIGYVAGALVAVLDWGLPLDVALNRPHVINRNGATFVEQGSAEADAIAEGLAALGHEVRRGDLNSGLHAIALDGGGLAGAVDRRREGVALGR